MFQGQRGFWAITRHSRLKISAEHFIALFANARERPIVAKLAERLRDDVLSGPARLGGDAIDAWL